MRWDDDEDESYLANSGDPEIAAYAAMTWSQYMDRIEAMCEDVGWDPEEWVTPMLVA